MGRMLTSWHEKCRKTTVLLAADRWEGDMIAKRFKVGERVKARATIGQVRVGMLGTIRRAFISIPDAYDVQFDDYPVPRMMQRRELERVERASQYHR